MILCCTKRSFRAERDLGAAAALPPLTVDGGEARDSEALRFAANLELPEEDSASFSSSSSILRSSSLSARSREPVMSDSTPLERLELPPTGLTAGGDRVTV